jgi:hypothetical protein
MAGVDGVFWGAADEESAARAPSAGTTTSFPSIRPSSQSTQSQSASEKSAPSAAASTKRASTWPMRRASRGAARTPTPVA